MSWAKLDDRYDDNRKVKRAFKRDPRAVAIHAMAITYSSRHNTDGVVDIDWLEDRMPRKAERDKTIGVLVDTGLFDVIDSDHWMVHDYLDYNASKQARTEASNAAREAALVRWANAQQQERDADSNANRNAERIADSNAEAMRDPMPPPARPGPSVETALSDEPDGDEIKAKRKASHEQQQVFDAWVQATKRSPGRTQFTTERRRVIAAALKSYPLEDCLAAVTNIGADPWAMGVNDRNTPFNDVEHALKGAKRIEKYRDFRGGIEPRGDGFGERLKARTLP
jgi:hypothetical protein